MIEVEVKIRISDLRGFEKRITSLGANLEREEHHLDIYYASPVRDFLKTDEALRLREITTRKGQRATLTYKGPKVYVGESQSKSRKEIEAKVEDLGNLREILKELGFIELARIEKTRHYYSLDGLPIMVDVVEGLGEFIEIGTAVPEDQVAEVERGISKMIAKLGLNRENIVPETYLELLLASGTPQKGGDQK
jgi:adenylate cyclase class 2